LEHYELIDIDAQSYSVANSLTNVAKPTQSDQEARAAFALAWNLPQQDQTEAAERWFVRAGELAPHDFTIRRGFMPIRAIDASGPAFFEIRTDWAAKGIDQYKLCATWHHARKISQPNRYPKPTFPSSEFRIRSAKNSSRKSSW
jgi:hypothetical protein